MRLPWDRGKNNNAIDTLAIVPHRHYDEEIDAFVLKDGSYIDFFEVIPKDRENQDPDELRFDALVMTRFYKLYSDDMKWISLNFPMNTQKQRAFKQRKFKETIDPVRRRWIERQIAEFERLDSNIGRREFFLSFSGENRDDFLRKRKKILGDLGTGKGRVIKEITKDKKIRITYKMLNMNTLVTSEEHEEIEEDIE